MKFTVCLSLLLTGLLQVHCHHVPGHHEEQEHNRDQNPPEAQPPAEGQGTETTGYKKIARINNDFALRLYNLIASDSASQNIFFSPLSISTAVALLTLGAKAVTHHQIFNGLGFNLSDTEENEIHEAFKLIVHTLNQPSNITQVNMGNALFIQESVPLLPKFQNDVRTFYEAEGFPINFKNSAAAENEINDYVKNKTNGKIPQAVQELDADTSMVLVNHIFFKDLSCWVVRVPYKGDYSAWFILPDQGKLKGVEDALTTEILYKFRSSLKYDEIELYIPKCTISGSYDVKDLLQKQGMNDVFNENADLSGITGRRNLKVSKVVHKAVLDVHEGGTEAAAVTVVEFKPFSARFPPPPTIKFQRPYIILIGSKHIKHFIFIAKVMNPTMK